ncbi:unannotated protein [freshwater metagenome]|uniref:Unannotated protein n=1 Tax=freshwater metagenome TaxID=449393 RepID=A0A6J6KEM8_9ZZZZ
MLVLHKEERCCWDALLDCLDLGGETGVEDNCHCAGVIYEVGEFLLDIAVVDIYRDGPDFECCDHRF